MSTDNRSGLAYGEMIPKISPDDTDGKPAALTIRKARVQNMARKGAPEENKIVLTFAEEFDAREGFNGDDAKRREYVVNSGSYKTLSMKLGPDHTKWIGKTVVMAPTTTTFNNETFEKLHVATPDRWEKVVNATARAASKRK